MNERLFFAIYNISKENKIISKLSVILTVASGYIYLFFYCIFGLTQLKNPMYFVIPFLTLFFSKILRKILKVERPFVKYNFTPLIRHKESYSLPSSHSVSAMVISLSIYPINREVGTFLMFFSLFTGLSRVLTGVHYPRDILLGFVIGFVGGIYFLI